MKDTQQTPDRSAALFELNRYDRKRLKMLQSTLGEVSSEVAVKVAFLRGLDAVLSSIPNTGRASTFRVHHRVPVELWKELLDLAKLNGRSANDEITAALEHWVETVKTKKGEAPA